MKKAMNNDVHTTGQAGTSGLASLQDKGKVPELPSKRIETFKDLLEEEQRLTMKLKREKDIVTEGLYALREKVEPASELLTSMNKVFGVKEKPGIVAHGVDMVMDLFAKKYIFKRSGWLMTLVGSYAVRGISQYILKGKKKGDGNDHHAGRKAERAKHEHVKSNGSGL